MGTANIIIFDVAFTIASSIVVVVIPLSVNKCLESKINVITFISVLKYDGKTLFRFYGNRIRKFP